MCAFYYIMIKNLKLTFAPTQWKLKRGKLKNIIFMIKKLLKALLKYRDLMKCLLCSLYWTKEDYLEPTFYWTIFLWSKFCIISLLILSLPFFSIKEKIPVFDVQALLRAPFFLSFPVFFQLFAF